MWLIEEDVKAHCMSKGVLLEMCLLIEKRSDSSFGVNVVAHWQCTSLLQL